MTMNHYGKDKTVHTGGYFACRLCHPPPRPPEPDRRSVARFLNANVRTAKGNLVAFNELYAAYCDWMEGKGRVVKKKDFVDAALLKGLRRQRISPNFVGVKLKER